MEHHTHTEPLPTTLMGRIKAQWNNYLPLIVILLFCLLLPFVQSTTSMMYGFMGYFLIFLSMFKFFDLNGFVEGFKTYDLVTQKFPIYGYIYPFIELLLGLAYLAQFYLVIINILTIIVMTAAAVGVVKSILSGQKLHCACLGTVLKVPLSTVSVLENVGMVVMAVWQLIASMTTVAV